MKQLASLGIDIPIHAASINVASEEDIDSAWEMLQSSGRLDLDEHPRIAVLRHQVQELEAHEDCKKELIRLIDVYRNGFIDGTAVPHEGWSDLESLIHYAPGMALELGLYKIGQKADEAAKREYQRVKPLINDIQIPTGLIAESGDLSIPLALPCKGYTLFCADLALCAMYLQTNCMIPVFDSSISTITRILEDTTHPELLMVLSQVAITDIETLARLSQEDPRIVWISCGSQYGLPLRYDRCKIAMVYTDGRLYGIVSASAHNGGYKGLTLYQWQSTDWAEGGYGRKIVKFECGKTRLFS